MKSSRFVQSTLKGVRQSSLWRRGASVSGSLLERSHSCRGFSESPSMRGSKHTTFGVALDIDGVLYRGSEMIESAPSVLETLKKRNIPFLLLTNGGGHTETVRAERMSKAFGIDISPDQIQLAHTPMQQMAKDYKDKLVLCVGKPGTESVLNSYGFENVITVDDLHANFPVMFPDTRPEISVEQARSINGAIEGVFVIMDPLLWSRELQICVDVLRSDGTPGTLSPTQKVPVFLSCPDFEYVNEWRVPRFGAGTFGMCLDFLYEKSTGQRLQSTIFGKPNLPHYKFAEEKLEAQAKQLGWSGIHQIYAVGDNPLSDIAGANGAGDKWHSILTCTGMYEGGIDSNDAEHPADKVVENVGDACTYMLGRETLPNAWTEEVECASS